MGYREFTELPVWQAARKYKLSIYKLSVTTAIAKDVELRGQLRRSASKPPAHIAEAYGRFDPADSARLLTTAKAEIAESQNHLIDAVDQQYITEPVRLAHHELAQDVIDQIDKWRSYLQSPEALENVRSIRERRAKKRRERNQNKNRNRNTESESE